MRTVPNINTFSRSWKFEGLSVKDQKMCTDMVLLWLILLHAVPGFVCADQDCPEKCLCPTTNNQVTCDGAGFSEIPSRLPPAVTSLDMNNNNLAMLTSTSLASLRNVVTLKLKGNELTQIHNGAFEPMISLQTLDLGSNELTTLNQYTFQGLSGLMHLDLSSNQLSNIEGGFAFMAELSRLDLSKNKITTLTQYTFRDLKNLRYLLLAGNHILQIDRRAFKNLEKLMYLVLKGNPIGEVTRYSFNSLFLSYVDLSECGLTKVPKGLPNTIRYLQLRRNNMTVIHRHSFDDCPYISILVLDENGIQEIQDHSLEHMTYLAQLWLNNNQLRNIPHPLPPTLQRLLMDSNLLTDITDVFPDNSQINTLSFMGNNVSWLTYDAFHKLSMLESLDLSNNHIKHIYGNTFINNTKLKTLQLSKNPLTYFHSRCFQGLRTLSTLSLAYIPTHVFMYWDVLAELKGLTKIDLDSSPSLIRALFSSDELLRGIRPVEELSMLSADISTLRPDFPELFPDLLVLRISSTRWHCDTSLLWLRAWLMTTTVQVENKDDIRCFTPRELHDRPLTALAVSEYIAATVASVITHYPTAPLTTFTTGRPTPSTSTTTRTPRPRQRPTSHRPPEDSYESESELDTFDIADIDLVDPENSFPFPPDLNSKSRESEMYVPPTSDEITWEEILSNSSSETQDKHIVPTENPYNEGKYSVQNNNLSLQTAPTSDTALQPVRTPSSDEAQKAGDSTMMLIIVATTVTTVVIAAILIATIVYFSRKGRKRNCGPTGPSPSKRKCSLSNKSSQSSLYQNGIKYKHRNEVLYFMPASGEGSTTDSLQTNASTTKEANMALVPGRDINHEGPLRCYKWEDF